MAARGGGERRIRRASLPENSLGERVSDGDVDLVLTHLGSIGSGLSAANPVQSQLSMSLSSLESLGTMIRSADLGRTRKVSTPERPPIFLLERARTPVHFLCHRADLVRLASEFALAAHIRTRAQGERERQRKDHPRPQPASFAIAVKLVVGGVW